MEKWGLDQIPVLISKQNRLENFFTRKILVHGHPASSPADFILEKKAYFGQENLM